LTIENAVELCMCQNMDMKEKIVAILKENIAGVDVDSKALVDDGFINSLAMIQLVSELDIAFDIEITFEAITKENFNSVEAMERMVRGYLQK